MREGLACKRGRVGPNSNHWTTSLIANGLLRTRTARDAIRLIGAMVEEYGFLYYRAPGAGVALPIADDREVWLMEIFGPGEDWTPESGRPGGVWCAQRIPDGEVGCSANRSRIGTVDLEDADHFLASDNIFALAEQLGLWKPGTPFVWHDVYGGTGNRSNSLREWRAFEPGRTLFGSEVHRRSGLGPLSFLGETRSTRHGAEADGSHARQLRRDGIRYHGPSRVPGRCRPKSAGVSVGYSRVARVGGRGGGARDLHTHERLRPRRPTA